MREAVSPTHDQRPTAAHIRVLLADDRDLFRTGLAVALDACQEIDVVAEASDRMTTVRLAEELRPDVILLAFPAQDLDGDHATRAILDRDPSARVVALVATSDESDLAAAMRAGACGCVLKTSGIGDIVAAVAAAADGAAWFAPSAAKVLLERIRRDDSQRQPVSGPEHDLSPRELEVLQLIARGLDNPDIAAELCISPRTAKHHVSSVLAKLGVPNRVQAAVYAVRQRIA
jgi:NarL family two-component system response regulator LiaR